jgi:hypothetical protein
VGAEASAKASEGRINEGVEGGRNAIGTAGEGAQCNPAIGRAA